MKRIAVIATVFVVAASTGALAQDTRVFRDLLVVDASGRKIGSVADGLGDERQISVLAETRNRRPFLMQMFTDGFVGSGTVRYTGAGCTGEAWAEGVVDPSLHFIETAQIGVDPATGLFSAFLHQRGGVNTAVHTLSYWYEGVCTEDEYDFTGRRFVPVKDLSMYAPPFTVSLYGHEAVPAKKP